MKCPGNFHLEESIRRTWYSPEAILKAAGLRKGMVFMDIGSGDGFFTLLASKFVGVEGIVNAVDGDADAIERLRARANKLGLTNVRVRVGEAEETVLCTACADIVFYSMVLHDFKDLARVLWNAKKMLKPTGKLVDLDWKKAEMSVGPPFKIRLSEQDVMGLLKMTGFKVETVKDAGPYHYLIIAHPNGTC